MLDDLLRPLKDRLLLPLARVVPLRPNTLTLLALVSGLLASFAALSNHPFTALALWLLNRVLDGLDGLVARHTHTQSDFGGFLDIMCDFAVYATLPPAVAIAGGSPLVAIVYLISFSLNSACLFMVAAVLVKREGPQQDDGPPSCPTTVPLPTGFAEGGETVVAFTLMLALPAYAGTILWFFTALIFATIAQRVVWAWRNL